MRTILLLVMAAGPVSAQAPLERLAWLGGCWQNEEGNRTTVEMWMPPQGGVMMGTSRTVANGQARGYEYMRIWAEGNRIVFTAIPSGQAEADFRSVAVSDSGFTVENLEHDFPQRITYRRTSPDNFVAHVEGPGPTGTRGFEVAFTRTSCVADSR